MMAALVLLAIAALFGPQLWARHVLARNAAPRPDLPGSGAEFARHLLERARMSGYAVERAGAAIPDHFDPLTRSVRLSPACHDGRSLTAIVVAAHEVGHAIQHYIGYRPLGVRTRLARGAAWAERAASVMLVAMPIITLVTRMPAAGAMLLGGAVAVMCVPALVHLATLPVEIDASFRRALPILRMGYLAPADVARARVILAACALTYVSASLAGILNFWRWLRILRR